MSGQQPQTTVVDVKQLVLNQLRNRRDVIGQVNVDDLTFEDAAWRVIVRPTCAWPDGYAVVLSEVEESVFDESGVNVMLIPTKQ